ncbi:kinase-like domain-containing protein [Chaetomium strumarium]|uniref:Kinase-like domain-containing protein n=1 Tax=Chaetomium strumarium TaxID=1170767 RepID=A0AAJ0M439_9PEZI|nr:kinase-like domain-containing protein [Chaetomium strumarium]
MADEYCKLIEAVSRIHDDRPSIHIRPHDDTTTCGTKSNVLLYGRHGDIKPSNVLWAESTQRLVLPDFGLSALQSTLSKEEQSGLQKFQMMTYRAPEFDVKEGIASRCSDVYGMACLFLEHITLFLMGEDGVREFTSARLAEDQKLGWKKADVFYTVSEDLQTATLKKEVKDWIEQLRRQPDCSRYIWRLLRLIETRMLEPDPANRITAKELVAEQQTLQHLTALSDSFYQKHWTETEHHRD